jgi:tetratricopeptide (TPR) repeat protein
MTPQSTFDRQASHNAFVGRERELAELRAGLDDATAGRGCLFLISGEPGIGKTRLAEEISNDASARGMLVVWGRCWEGGGAPAYWPIIQMLRTCIDDRDGEQLKALLGSGASEIARLIPELKLSLPSLEETKATTDSESARFRLFDAVATLLKNVARNKPLLIVIDDLHDSDQPSLQMLRFVARETKGARILILGTYRDVEVRQSPELGKLIGDLIREGRTVSIAGLSQSEVGEYVERSSAKKADDKLVADLYHATDGNPLFVDGVVRLLSAEGKLERTGLDVSAFKIPDGVRESIRRRLVALSDETNSLLSIASVIGNEFDMRLLERVSGRSTEQIVEQTDQAVRIGVLRPRTPGFARHQFSHALIREVLYDDLPANQRIELHCDISAASEEIYKSDLTPHLAELANHFREAGFHEKAIDYSIRAGESARVVFAYEQAVSHFKVALDLMERHGEGLERQARLMEKLGNSIQLADKAQLAGIAYLKRALEIYEKIGQTERAGRVHTSLGVSSADQEDYALALEHYRKAEVLLQRDPEGLSLGFVYASLAAVYRSLGRTAEGLASFQRAMELAENLGNELLSAHAAAQGAECMFSCGHLAEAFALLDKAREVADRTNDPRLGQRVAIIGGRCRQALGDPRDAKSWLLRELSKARAASSPTTSATLRHLIAWAHSFMGQLGDARRVWGDTPNRVLGILALYEGDWDGADAILAGWLEFSRRGGGGWLPEAIFDYAFVLRARSLPADALGILLDSPTLTQGYTRLPIELETRTALVLVYADLGRILQAVPHLNRCREIIGDGEDWRGLVGAVARAEAVVAGAEGKYQDAEAQFEKAVEIFRRYHVPFEEAEALHYWGRALNASGEHGRAHEKLDAAIEIYRRCGAGERWVERVEADRASSPSPTDRGEHPADAQRQAMFRREGDYWTIAYEGKTWRLKDAKGLHYVAYLLAHPGEEIRALHLVTRLGGGGDETVEKASAEDIARSDTVAGNLGHAGEILDAQAKAAYGRRLAELQEELEEARELGNEERAEKAEDEKEALGRELRGAIGLAGRDRRSASATERGRIAVTKAIRLSLNKIAENDASLGKLLSTTIKTGTVCAYVPDDRFPVSWRL